MKVDAELLADHAFGILHVGRRIQGERGRQSVQDDSSRMRVGGGRGGEHPVDVVFGHSLAADRRSRAETA